MLFVNDQLFDPEDSSHPQYDFYQEKVEELKYLFDKNKKPSQSGRKYIVIRNLRSGRRNEITGWPEKTPAFTIPLKATKRSDRGYSVVWRYSDTSPTFENGHMKFDSHDIIFNNMMVIYEDELDKAFYLIYIAPEVGLENKGGVQAIVEDNTKKATEIASAAESDSDIDALIFSSRLSVFSTGDDGIDFLFKIARAWNVGDVDHMQDMYMHFKSIGRDKDAKGFIDECKVLLKEAVINGAHNGIPIEKFIEAVMKDPKWLDVRVDVLDAVNNDYIKINKQTGKVYFDLAGDEETICTVGVPKRSGVKYVEDVVNILMESEGLMEILQSLKEEAHEKTDGKSFNPKMFNPKNSKVEELKYPDKMKLAKYLEIDVSKNTKGKELDELIPKKYKEMGVL